MAVRTSLMEFQIPRIVHEEVEDNRGVFVIEPLDRGFGYTFGNSLRRVLLSSLEGAAVTSVKIEGVAHEFTTLPGVREDVTDILLNFKNLICRLHGESPEIEVRLTKKGAGAVKASDIEAPAELEILNPELEIANLSDKGKLEVTLTIGRGRGYVPAELNRGPEHTIGVIPIDSIFSPVRRVSYDVEAARVGQRTDYDKLRIDITTDGSIDPRDSIGQAAEILIRQLAIFTDLDRIEGFGEQAAAEAQAEPALAHGMENFPIEELELGVRSYNCLKRVGIETIGDLVTRHANVGERLVPRHLLPPARSTIAVSLERIQDPVGILQLIRGDDSLRAGPAAAARVERVALDFPDRQVLLVDVSEDAARRLAVEADARDDPVAPPVFFRPAR